MERVKLGDICNIQSGGTPIRTNTKFWNKGNIPWCKISDLKGKYVNYTEEKITIEGLEHSSAKLLKKGTILYTIFATIGDVAILNIDSATNQAIAGIQILSDNLNVNYIYYYLKSIKSKMIEKSRGVAQNNINLSILRNLELNIVDINQQRKIANELDKLQGIIDIRKKQIEELDGLIKSQFVEIFENNECIEKKKIINICKSIVRGPFGSDLKKEFFVPKGDNTYKVYEQKNAINENSSLGTYYIDENKFNELRRFECKPGDIIMSCSGTIGKIYQLPNDIEKGIINQALLKFTLDYSKVLPIYFLEFIKSNIQSLEIKGTGLQNLGSVSYIKEMEISVPKIEKQKQFVELVEQINKQKSELQKSLGEMEKLQESLMNKYFG